jgi:plasmid replication initiation protein
MKDKKELIVYDKPNSLIAMKLYEGKALTALQLNIFTYLIANIDEVNCFVDIQEYSGTANTSHNYTISEIEDALMGLKTKAFKVPLEDNKILITSLIDDAIVDRRNNRVECSINDNIKPLFKELKIKLGYTKGNLRTYFEIRSANAKIIYEMLKQWQNTKYEIIITVSELKEKLNLIGNYKAFKDFEINVLKKTKDEINSSTDMTVSYAKIKKGRSIHAIKFIFAIKKTETNENDEMDKISFQIQDKIHINKAKEKLMIVDEFSDIQIYKLLMIAQEKVENKKDVDVYSYMFKNLYYTRKKQPKNMFSYYMKALEENYANA